MGEASFRLRHPWSLVPLRLHRLIFDSVPLLPLALSPLSYYSFIMYDEGFERITQNPAVMGGKPCIRGMRVTVGMIVGQMGAGVSTEELLSDYPYLEREDIMQAAALAQF